MVSEIKNVCNGIGLRTAKTIITSINYFYTKGEKAYFAYDIIKPNPFNFNTVEEFVEYYLYPETQFSSPYIHIYTPPNDQALSIIQNYDGKTEHFRFVKEKLDNTNTKEWYSVQIDGNYSKDEMLDIFDFIKYYDENAIITTHNATAYTTDLHVVSMANIKYYNNIKCHTVYPLGINHVWNTYDH